MAGSKLSKARDDKTKKRKGDVIENDARSKRPRAQQGKGAEAQTGDSKSINGPPKSLVLHGQDHKVGGLIGDGETGWRISKPMGGRMLDIDPILTADEEHLILAYNTSVQVYTASDSLLLRRIPISTLEASAPKGTTPASVVSTRLSKIDPDFLWVACSDGRIYHVNWTQNTDTVPSSFQTTSGTAKAMVIIPNPHSSKKEDVVLVAESDKSNRLDVVAYQGDVLNAPVSHSVVVLKRPGNGLQLLETSQDGRILVGAQNDRLFIGVASTTSAESAGKLSYDFLSFDTPDLITTIDFRVYERPFLAGKAKKDKQTGSDQVVDILVGGARGGIYLYHDAVSRLQALGKSNSQKETIHAQKFHWHRRAVHAVKWSPDGNYIFSGGSENVLVIWQMDTDKKDFLPHLSGSVENITVSATGSSYVVHLDDNSTMIISTADMKPTTYVSGIQSAAVDTMTPKDLLVKRVWTAPGRVRRPIPAAIRPTEPLKLHVCVGNGRQATTSGNLSAPLLQTFDLETFTSVSKQALARTHPTDVNITKQGHPIDEPLVTHIAFSGDGKWMASVDEWVPSMRDVENIASDTKEQLIKERQETYLKFWEAQDGAESIALVSRINAPHSTVHPETVLDLASDTTSACFATIGSDGMVRLWQPKTRQQYSKAVDSHSVFWSCARVIPVGHGLGEDTIAEHSSPTATPANIQGKIAFSEDGSTLFAAFGAEDTGAVYVIDTASGEIVQILEGLWEGQLQAIRSLSQFVIVLSDELRVYDVVGDDLRYGIVIPKIPDVAELLQLAVDPTSGRFAVTLPIGDISSIGVFDPEVPEPLIVRSTPHRVVSLVSAPGSSGFIALDDAAQIWSITEGSDPSSLMTAQPLQDIRLDAPEAAQAQDRRAVVLAAIDYEPESDDEMEEADVEDMDVDDDDSHVRVLAQQHLADIFDAAPSFAAPSIEDMFYKVTDLLATKPLSIYGQVQL